jgi:hypothetical protein
VAESGQNQDSLFNIWKRPQEDSHSLEVRNEDDDELDTHTNPIVKEEPKQLEILIHDDYSMTSLEVTIFNFYGLYFGYKNVFCKKVANSKCGEPCPHEEDVQSKKKKKISIWSSIKSFFSKKSKKKKSEDNIVESLEKVGDSQQNQRVPENDDFSFEFPGLSESQIESLIAFYFYPKQHQCEFCEEETVLIKNLLQKDILLKINRISEMTLESIRVINCTLFGKDSFQNLLDESRSLKLDFKEKRRRDQSTRPNTNFLDSPDPMVSDRVKIEGIKNSLHSSSNFRNNEEWGNYRDKRTNFCEYDFDFKSERKSKQFKNNVSINSSKNFQKQRNPVRHTWDKGSGQKEDTDAKIRRMSLRQKSKLSNFLKGENPQRSMKFLSTPKKSETGIRFETEGRPSLGRLSMKSAKEELMQSIKLHRRISVPKSKINLDWSSSSRLQSLVSPSNKISMATLGNLNFGDGFASQRNIKGSRKRTLDLKQQQVNINFGNLQVTRDKKKGSLRGHQFLNSLGREKKKGQENVQPTRREGLFRMDIIDDMEKGVIKDLDFSQLNSVPRK